MTETVRDRWTNKDRLKAGREIEEILQSYGLTIMNFTDAEINHFIDLWFIADRDLAISIICNACLHRLAYGI